TKRRKKRRRKKTSRRRQRRLRKKTPTRKRRTRKRPPLCHVVHCDEKSVKRCPSPRIAKTVCRQAIARGIATEPGRRESGSHAGARAALFESRLLSVAGREAARNAKQSGKDCGIHSRA